MGIQARDGILPPYDHAHERQQMKRLNVRHGAALYQLNVDGWDEKFVP